MGLSWGSYLKKPKTEKESTDATNNHLICGACDMQGWRSTQEDAHNCILDFDKGASFFAVYDGHGGHEVAQYCSQKLPDFIKNSQEYKDGKIEEALTEGFLQFDATITTPEVIKVLKAIKKLRVTPPDSETSEDEENVNNLYEEATMPIEQVMEKYVSNPETTSSNKSIETKQLKKDNDESLVGSSSASSAAASCSTSTIADEAISSSEAAASVPGTLSANASEAESKPEMSSNEVGPIQNGEISTPSATSKSNDDVSSSTRKENGEPMKKDKGKAVIKKGRQSTVKITGEQLYKAWLNFQGQEEDDSEDSDDEEDKTFEGPHEESSDDDDEGVNIAIEASESSDEQDGGDDEEEVDEEAEKENMDDDDESDEDIRPEYAMSEKVGIDSGCTAVVALLNGNELYVANAGDSRCIVCRKGEAIDMSVDHKPEDDIERNRIKKAGGRVNDGRVNAGLNLSRAIGDHSYKQNKELTDREQMITALPDIKRLTINPNEDEFMVLACDGIWNSLSSQAVADFVRERISKHEKLSKICEELFDSILAENTAFDGAGCDNMTAMIIKFKSNKREASPLSCNESKKSKAETTSEAQVDTTV